MWKEILIPLFPSLIVAVTASWITVRLSVKQFRTQRWWDRKVDAYSRITESLHHLIEFGEARSEYYVNGIEHDVDRIRQLRRSYLSAQDELNKAFNIGSFVISNAAVDVLEKLGRFNEVTDDFGDDGKEVHVYRTALTQIRQIAKKDLNVY